jgi:hypothetical protein
MGTQSEAEQFPVLVVDSWGRRTQATLTVWEAPATSPTPAALRFEYDGTSIDVQARDYFSAMTAIRRRLEVDGRLLCCNGAGRNVYPSGMGLSMSLGALAYKHRLGERPTERDQVSIFDVDDDIEPSTVDEQDRFIEEWKASLRRA